MNTESKDLAALTPSQIVVELDKSIIGQHEAKRHVAIALRNRWRRMNAPEAMQREITPNNILMIGSTGVGKTEIARRLAKLAEAPFVKVEASKFTEVGYVGRDVESMVRDLVENAIYLVKATKKEAVREKAQAATEEAILDALLPSAKKEKLGFDPKESDTENATREIFRKKLRNGELDNRKIEVSVEQAAPNMAVGGPLDEGTMNQLQEMLGGIIPKHSKKRKITIADARKILFEEEANRLVDMDEVKDEAIKKAENLGIIFIDEIDKIASSRNGGGSPDVSREGVQRDLLPIVEGSTVNTKHGPIHTDHVLFIAAGAFHVSKPSDLIPELQGRFPIRVELQALGQDDFYQILKEPTGALTKQYQALLHAERVNLTFQDEALRALARIAWEANAEVENIGARRLQTVMSHLMNDLMYDIPDRIGANAHVVVTAEMVELKLAGLVKNRDLSQFIL
jgi:ATP-dependent HslUV protease ATP-binding subunit HslU